MNFLTMWFLHETFKPKKKSVPAKKVSLPQVKKYTAEQFCYDRFYRPWKVGKLK